MSIDAVIFDLYGTLVDIYTDEWDLSTYRVLSQFLSYYDIGLAPEGMAAKYQEYSAVQLLEHPGPFGEIDVFRVFEEMLAEGLGKQPERNLVAFVARLFQSLTRRHFGFFPDTLPALEELARDYRLGIVSDAQWDFSEPEIRMLGLMRFLTSLSSLPATLCANPTPRSTSTRSRACDCHPLCSQLAELVSTDRSPGRVRDRRTRETLVS